MAPMRDRRGPCPGHRIALRSAPRPTPWWQPGLQRRFWRCAQAGPCFADCRLPLLGATAGPDSTRSSAAERPKIPNWDPAFYGLSETDLDISFRPANTYFGAENMTLRQILQALRETYCGTIGAEFMHGFRPAEKRWWQQRLEKPRQAQLLR